MKEYEYLGYTFRATSTIHGNSGRNLYEIDDLKERGKRPFLTTINGCKEYIRQYGKIVKANKTKLIALCREMGYHPPRDAEFTKAFRDRSWWLEWGDDGICYKASLFLDAGRVFLGVRMISEERDYEWNCFNVTNDQLSRLGLVENKCRTLQRGYSLRIETNKGEKFG